MKRVVVRADGSSEIGMGHVMRCLTLASGLERAGAGVLFISRNYSEAVTRIIRGAGADHVSISPYASPAEDLDAAVRGARGFKACAVICDGYFLDEAYFKGIKAAGLRLVIIDDLADRPMPADLVLNQNVDATKERYGGLVGHDTRLLLGTRYCLIRDEFLVRRKRGRDARRMVKEVLVTLGGSDPDNHTLKVLRALDSALGDFKVTAVLGATNPNIKAVRSFAASSRKATGVLVGTGNMAELMARADMGITASGTTSYETACLGLPVITVSIAQNQEGIGRTMGDMGVSVYLGRAETVGVERITKETESLIAGPEKMAEMSRRGMELVDGQGAGRAASEISSLLETA